jgi:hypothetical protein
VEEGSLAYLSSQENFMGAGHDGYFIFDSFPSIRS